MWDYILVLACGGLSAFSAFLLLKLNRIQRQQSEIVDLWQETLYKGLKVEVNLSLDGSQGGGDGAARGVAAKAAVVDAAKKRAAERPSASRHSVAAKPAWVRPQFVVKLTFAAENSEGKPFLVYLVNAMHDGGSSIAQKRFAQFRRLHRDMQARNDPTVVLPALKPVSVRDIHNEAAVEESKQALQDYLNKLPEKVFSWPEIQEFFDSGFNHDDAGSSGELSDADISPLGEMPLRVREGDADEEDTPLDDKAADEPILPPVPQGLTAVNVKTDSSVMYIDNWDYLNEPKKIRALSAGKTFFTFACHSASTLSAKEKVLVSNIVNLSSFADEAAENEAPYIDINDPDTASQYTVGLVKNGYMLPGVSIDMLSPELLCSQEYLHGCMPGKPKIWKEVPDNTTFRITKTIIPWVFTMTIQFKVSVIPKSKYAALSKIDDCPVHFALLLERTKRDKSAQDATRKAKAVLLYTVVEGGLFMRNITVALNSWIPSFVRPCIDTLGSLGSQETNDTAVMTRKFFKAYIANLKR